MRPKARVIARKALLILGVVVGVSVATYVYNRLAAAGNAVQIETLSDGAQSPEPVFNGTVRLACFNIAHGRGTNESNLSNARERHARLQEIAGLLRQERADIVVLNEVDFESFWSGHEDQAERVARAAGFKYVLRQRNADAAIPFLKLRFGNAILSRFPLQNGRRVDLPRLSRFEDLAFGSKKAAVVEVSLSQDTRIRLLAVHLEPRDELIRIQSAQAILDLAKQSHLPLFCLGDFNSRLSTSSSSGATSHPGPTAMDSLLSSGQFSTWPSHGKDQESLTFPSFAPDRTIDWILIPAHWTALSSKVPATTLSDHLPVIAEIRQQ